MNQEIDTGHPESLLIWDCKDQLSVNGDFVIFWQRYSINNAINCLSIPQLVEENEEELKSQYLALIYDLGKLKVKDKTIIENLEITPGFSYWWMSLLAEKCNHSKSYQIDNIIKLMAFSKWLRSKNYTAIRLVSENKALADSLKNLAKSLKIKFDWDHVVSIKPNVSLIRKIFNKLPIFMKALVSSTLYLFNHWQLRNVGIDGWKNSTAKITFISYLAHLDAEKAKNNIYKCGFWGSLPDELNKKKIQINWLHIYIKDSINPSAGSAKILVEQFNNRYKNQQNHVFIDSFLSVKVLKDTVMSLLRLVFKYKKINHEIKQYTDYYWPLFSEDVKLSLIGINAVENILTYYLFLEAMKSLPTQNQGFYLQENQGWEYGFIDAWKRSAHNELIGVQHSTVRYWDLRYYFDSRSYNKENNCNLPRPDKVAVNGNATKDAYLAGQYPADDLIELEALRYLYLEEMINLNKNPGKSYERDTVLVLGDYLPKNTDYQMTILQQASHIMDKKIEYIVKPHPAYPIKTEDYPDLKLKISNLPIPKLLDHYSVVLTGGVTSAAVDAFCAGKYVISILDPRSLNLSPLKVKGIKGVTFVSSVNELAQLLNNIDKININININQGEDYFYIERDLPRWRKLLKVDGNETL